MAKFKSITFKQVMIGFCLFISSIMIITSAHENLTAIPPTNPIFVDEIKLSLTSQIEDMTKASNLSVLMHMEAQKLLAKSYKSIITQQDIINQINTIARSEGGDNALSFPTLIYSGDDFQFLHGNPHDDIIHPIDPRSESLVMIDLGAKYNGMCSDVTRTYFFENASDKMKQAYQVVLDAESAVIEAIHPGVKIGDLNDILYDVYNQSGFTMDGAYIYPNWGHGIGDYVHEIPVLGHPYFENYTIMAGATLAIEPNYYNLNEGWSVRVEDTILVTYSGNIILSEALSKQLDDLTIHPNDTIPDINIDFVNYSYHKTANITAYSEETIGIQTMEFYDGYNWRRMDTTDSTSFTALYYIDENYASELLGLLKITYDDGKIDYHSEKLLLYPEGDIKTYTLGEITARSDNYENTSYGGTYDLMTDKWSPSNEYSWIFSASGADMIRIHFKDASFNPDDFFLLLDETNTVIKEFFVFDNTSSPMDSFWTPWVSGSEIKLCLEALSEFGFHEFSFTIDQVEAISLQIPITSKSTTNISSSVPTSASTPAFEKIGGIGISILFFYRKRRRSIPPVIRNTTYL